MSKYNAGYSQGAIGIFNRDTQTIIACTQNKWKVKFWLLFCRLTGTKIYKETNLHSQFDETEYREHLSKREQEVKEWREKEVNKIADAIFDHVMKNPEKYLENDPTRYDHRTPKTYEGNDLV